MYVIFDYKQNSFKLVHDDDLPKSVSNDVEFIYDEEEVECLFVIINVEDKIFFNIMHVSGIDTFIYKIMSEDEFEKDYLDYYKNYLEIFNYEIKEFLKKETTIQDEVKLINIDVGEDDPGD